MRRITCLALAAAMCSCQLSCSSKSERPQRQVAVFTSFDQSFAEPIFRKFEQQTGIKVLPIYDEETSKTTAMINGIVASKGRPAGDVLWNNENVQTQRLAQMGLLESYSSPQAARYPRQWRDPQDRFVSFAARARVIIYNTDLVKDGAAPRTLQELADPKWKGKIAIGRPFFGTCLTHAAALHQAWGQEKFTAFLRDLRANDAAFCPGNAPVRDMVASGQRAVGVVDTDDAYEAISSGKPVKAIVPDSSGGGLLIPNTVAVLKGCSHRQEARRLVDFLLSAEVERQLAQGPSAQIPLASDMKDQKVFWRLPPLLQYDLPASAASVERLVMLLQQEKMDR